MGGVGSGGRRAGAGRLRVPLRGFCRFCCRSFVARRRARVYCDLHQAPIARRDNQAAAVLGQAVKELARFEHQFASHPRIAGVVGSARAQLEVWLTGEFDGVSADVCTRGGGA